MQRKAKVHAGVKAGSLRVEHLPLHQGGWPSPHFSFLETMIQQVCAAHAVEAIYVAVGPGEMLQAIAASTRPLAALPRPILHSLVGGIPRYFYHLRPHHRRGGRCRWRQVAGQWLQGALEQRFAEALTAQGIAWIAHKTRSIPWTDADGRVRFYHPDFYLPGTQEFIEIKGFWTAGVLDKMRRIFRQHRRLRLRVLLARHVACVERRGLWWANG